MQNTYTIKGKLEILDRLKNSYYGNPRYLVSIGGVVCCTAPNANLAYGITNHRDKEVIATVGTHYNRLTIDTIATNKEGV